MVVNYSEEGWDIITQRAHGILAAQIGMNWKAAHRPERWLETLLAIAEHDDAEVELDGENLLTQNGGPLNFTMKSFELAHCQKLAMLTITKSRYIALLISMHMVFLYAKDERHTPEAQAFLTEQRNLQSQWRKELMLGKEESEKIYSLLEWCDACSLLLCQREMQPEQRSVEVSYGPDNIKYHLYQMDSEKITIDPWPFDTNSFRVNFESRLIKQLQFSSSAEFRHAFLNAPVRETVWNMVKQKLPAKVKTAKV